jgi:hypothetical protein
VLHRSTLVLLAACSSPQAPNREPTPSTAFEIPRATAPILDGKIDSAEWAPAKSVELGSGVTLRFMHDGAKVYLAVSGLTSGTGFGCVMVADGDRVAIFHASAKLGSALYAASPGGALRPQSKDYVWREPDAMLREEGWTATTMRNGEPPQQEYAITFERLGLPNAPKPIAFGYFVSPPNAQDLSAAKVLAWPADLNDAVTNVQLVAGFNPDDIQFATVRWPRLTISAPSPASRVNARP